MNYMGSKNRIAYDILPIILYGRNEEQYYVEPFCGGLNTMDRVRGRRIASDTNVYLIEMWKALQRGEKMPMVISEELYRSCYESMKNKDGIHSNAEIGWVGFMGSFRGKFYSGYCATTQDRCYFDEHIRNILPQIPLLQGIEFRSGDYSELDIPDNSIVYCDPPYRNTTKYNKALGEFDYDKFYGWCREKSIGGGAESVYKRVRYAR